MKNFLVLTGVLFLLTSCEILRDLWSPSDLQQLQTDSRGDITFSKVQIDPTVFVGRINQTMVFECRASSEFPIKKMTLDATSLIGQKLILPETSSGVWATNMRIYPLSEGSFSLSLVVSNEKGRVVTNVLSVSVKNQTIIYVASYGKDYYEGLKDFPIASINTAISNAIGKSISTLYIAGGNYTNSVGGAVLWMNAKTNLTFLGGWDSNFTAQQPDVSPTVLWGGGQSQTVGWLNKCSGIVLDGLKFVGGTNVSGDGGGLKILSSGITLSRVDILSNFATNNGGGLYIENSVLTLSNVTIAWNNASIRGGGVYMRQVSGRLQDSRIFTNRASHGAGMYVYGSSSNFVVENIDFVSNYAYPYEAGALYLDQSESVLTQVNFIGNFAYAYGGALFLNQSSPLIILNTFSNNQVSGFGYGGAICLQDQSHALIVTNVFEGNNGYNISEYLPANGNETSPAELKYNKFGGISVFYRDTDGGGTINSLSALNALDENGYNPSNSVEGNF